jgi:hypothetical protein
VRETPRRRREIQPAWKPFIAPFFRFSHTRHAYILRGIGPWVGPVLVPIKQHPQPFKDEDHG